MIIKQRAGKSTSTSLENALQEKRILIVDDEPDILETLEELLSMCTISKATRFDQAKKQLEQNDFDFAILDIKGVDGYEILKIAKKKKVPAVMLTGYTISSHDPLIAYQEGANYYVPKEKMETIEAALLDILEARQRGTSSWESWKERFGAYFKSRYPSGSTIRKQSAREQQAGKWEKYFY